MEELRAHLPLNPALRHGDAGIFADRDRAQRRPHEARVTADANSRAGRCRAAEPVRSAGRAMGRAHLLGSRLSAGIWLWTMREPPGEEVASVDPDKKPLWPTVTAAPSVVPRGTPIARASASPSASHGDCRVAGRAVKVEPPPVKPAEPEPWEPMLAKGAASASRI